MNALVIIEIILGTIILSFLGIRIWKLLTYRTPKIEKREEDAAQKEADVVSIQRVSSLMSELKKRKEDDK